MALTAMLAPRYASAQGIINIHAGAGAFGPQEQELNVGSKDGWKFNTIYATPNGFFCAANIFSQNDTEWVGTGFSSLTPIVPGTYACTLQDGDCALKMNWNGISPAGVTCIAHVWEYTFGAEGTHVAMDFIGSNWSEQIRLNSNFQITPVPEPGPSAMIGFGIAGLFILRFNQAWRANGCAKCQTVPVRIDKRRIDQRR